MCELVIKDINVMFGCGNEIGKNEINIKRSTANQSEKIGVPVFGVPVL